jgi:hypothetical protein
MLKKKKKKEKKRKKKKRESVLVSAKLKCIIYLTKGLTAC